MLWIQCESKVKNIVILVNHDHKNHKNGGIYQHLFPSSFKLFSKNNAEWIIQTDTYNYKLHNYTQMKYFEVKT